VMHNSGNVLTSLMIRGRHFGVSSWLSTQKLSAISLVARVNFQAMLVWRLRNYKELESLIEELSALYPKKTLFEIYLAATDEPYSFWYILLTAKKRQTCSSCASTKKSSFPTLTRKKHKSPANRK